MNSVYKEALKAVSIDIQTSNAKSIVFDSDNLFHKRFETNCCLCTFQLISSTYYMQTNTSKKVLLFIADAQFFFL